MKTWIIVPVAALLLAGCETIVVDADDTTPPSIRVVISQPTNAEYADTGEAIRNAPLEDGRAFTFPTIFSDRNSILFVVSARDDESAVRILNAVVEMTLQCRATVPGGPVQRDITTSATASGTNFADPGTETSPVTLASLAVSFEEVWRQGCRNWGQIIDVRRGVIEVRSASIRVDATNNAGVSARFESPFTIGGSITVDLD